MSDNEALMRKVLAILGEFLPLELTELKCSTPFSLDPSERDQLMLRLDSELRIQAQPYAMWDAQTVGDVLEAVGIHKPE